MEKFARITALALLATLPSACGGHTGAIPSGTQPQSQTRQTQSIADMNGWTPTYATLPARGLKTKEELQAQAASALTIPFFTNSITSPLDGNTYTYMIAGSDPSTSRTTTSIAYVPIVARIHFEDGTVLDPTQPGCNDNVSVQSRFFDGPNFVPAPLTSNGVALGTVQLGDAQQRAEFSSLIKGTNYHTVLTAAAAPRVLDIQAPPGSKTHSGVCSGVSHRIGEIPINSYDAIVRSIAAADTTAAQVPVLLSYNVFLTSGGHCCVIGYHSAFGRLPGTEVYSVGTYNDPGIFSVPIEDIHAWTHEIGELLNDPFINNGTPAWGHVGQVSGCQNNLEVGDPLTGTAFALSVTGFTYHPQELAFFSWFFRTPSTGTGGLFSFNGTFKTAQGPCTLAK